MSTSHEAILNTNGRNRELEDKKTNGVSVNVQLDLSKIQALPPEQRDLYLFTFTLNLEHFVCDLAHDEICAQQASLNQQLLQIISLSIATPTRAVRKSLGRCFEYILARGDRKILYDSINQLIAVISAGKGEKELQSKHAAVYCLGEIYKTAGESAISLCSFACSTLIRLSKAAQNHAGLRAAILQALKKIIGAVRGAVDELIAKDVWKHARHAGSTDKAVLVQLNACNCLEQLIKGTSYFDTTGDFESLKVTIWKACESTSAVARRAASSCLASALVKSYSDNIDEKSVPRIKKPKKPKRKQSTSIEGDGEGENSRSNSPSTKRNSSKLEFSLAELLRQLSGKYVRPNTSNRARAAITHCYINVITSLSSKLIESHYGHLAEHLLVEVLSDPFVVHDRHRLLLTRRFVQKVLTDCVALTVLAESARFAAARTLINDIIKNYPQVLKERAEPPKHALIGALDALASLIKSLGSAFGSIGESCREALIQVIQHPSYSVQIHASYCLRIFVLACPQQFLPCASICMNSVSRELSLLNTGRQSSPRCVGFANGLAAILGVSPLQPLYSSLEISARVLSTAISLLKSSSQAEIRVSSTQVQVAWILIGGLMSLGPNFIKIHISQLLLLWRNTLPRPLTTENSGQRQSSEIYFLTHVRECALGSILSFLEFNNKLVTTDISRRIAAMLQNTIEFLDNLPARKINSDDNFHRSISSLPLRDLTLMVRRRVLQCYSRLMNFSPLSSNETLMQSHLVALSVSQFADSESYSPGSLGSSIANSAGNFENIWEIADNSAFGISGLIQGPVIKPFPGEHELSKQSGLLAKNEDSWGIDGMVCSYHPLF